jgi:hypothetical protein
MLAQGTSIGIIAVASGLTRQTIYRIKDDAGAAEKALVEWGM